MFLSATSTVLLRVVRCGLILPVEADVFSVGVPRRVNSCRHDFSCFCIGFGEFAVVPDYGTRMYNPEMHGHFGGIVFCKSVAVHTTIVGAAVHNCCFVEIAEIALGDPFYPILNR